MNKKKKMLIILITLIVLLITILIIRTLVEKHKKDNFVYTSIDQFKTPEDVIKYLGSDYIKQDESNEEGFTTDIYLKFKCDLYTGLHMLCRWRYVYFTV